MKSGFPLKRWLQWGGTLISAGLFIWLVSRQDWESVWGVVRAIPWWLLPVAYAGFLGTQLANAWRWYMVLRIADIPIPYWTAVKIVFLGAFASNFLPSTVGGDSVRYLSLLHFVERKGVGLLSLLVDRLLKMTSMLLISPLAVVFFGPLLWGDARRGAWMLPPAVQRYLRKGWETFTMWFANPGDFAKAFGVGFFSIFPPMLATLLVARGLHMPVGLQHIMGASVVTYFLTLLPVSVNGYGVQEVSTTALYVSLGASVEQGAALAVLTRLLMLAATLPGALWLPEILALASSKEKPRIAP